LIFFKKFARKLRPGEKVCFEAVYIQERSRGVSAAYVAVAIDLEAAQSSRISILSEEHSSSARPRGVADIDAYGAGVAIAELELEGVSRSAYVAAKLNYYKTARLRSLSLSATTGTQERPRARARRVLGTY
jgi:hypothetical protein